MVLAVIIVIVLVALYVFSTYNGLIRAKNLVKEAFSTMDVYLKKRWDLIPNIVETVKGYAKHEKETLEGLTSLRAGSYDNMSAEEKINVNKQLSQGLSKIIAVAENYPELKANENFIGLTQELSKVEGEIANSRKYYNGTVRNYNNKVQVIPSNIVAKLFGFKEEKMFETDEKERENVKVDF